MAQQKRDPETGKFISTAAFYAKYPNGLKPEEYIEIRNHARLLKQMHEHPIAADQLAEADPEGMPAVEPSKQAPIANEWEEDVDHSYYLIGLTVLSILAFLIIAGVIMAIF